MRLVLAVHLHEAVEPLVAEAVRWAPRRGATLALAYVDEYQYNLYLVEDPSVRAVLDEQWARVHARAEARLRALVDALPADVRGEALFLHGRAAETIVEVGQSRDAILIGTHGRKGLAHVLLGSVAERVVRTASVPVLVLHPKEKA